MKEKLRSIVLMISLLCILRAEAQESTSNGIKFERTLSFEEAKEKASKENKMIFLDAYTTWCQPCRIMDDLVFSQSETGDFFNQHFVNLKVQFDVTKKDDEQVKNWYEKAKLFKDIYKIEMYPTYLFFDAKGILVHRMAGATTKVDDFIAKAKDALIPDKQFYTLKQQYDAGQNNPEFLLLLIKASENARQENFLPVVINKYLATQKSLLTVENIKFLSLSTVHSSDIGFTVLKNHGSVVDSVLGIGTSEKLLKEIALLEIVIPFLRNGGTIKRPGGGMYSYTGTLNKTPDWTKLQDLLDSNYSSVKNKLFLEAQVMHYEFTEKWTDFSNAVSKYLASTNPGNGKLAEYAWTILVNSDDVRCINSALTWCKQAFPYVTKEDVSVMVIYANLLHKSGRQKEAVDALNQAARMSGDPGSRIAELISSVKAGKKTW